LSTSPLPSFEEALKSTEARLTKSLGQSCRLQIKRRLDDDLIKEIRRIESETFRQELRYEVEELLSRHREKEFLLFLVLCADQPIAFLHGYKDPSEESAFFLDTVATLREGRGVGSILVALTLLYSFERGYESVTLRTEEQDEKGRRLVHFYENLGFETFQCDPSEGVAMRRRLDPLSLQTILEKLLS